MNGEKRRRHGRSIRRRLLVPICLLLTVQVAVLIGGVYFSGLLERMDENAYAVLDQRVQSRAGYLEDDMVRRWSNLSLTQEVLGELYEGLVQDGSVTPGELASDPAQYNAFLEQAAPELVSLMRTNSVTGAFVVLNTQTFPQELSESLQLPGLYLRDRDPSAHTSAGNGDLLLERAPLELVRGLGIAMDSNWKPMFVLEGDTARANACLIRPYNAAVEDPSLGWENAGYWAAPHTLSGDNIRLISYSVPLIAPDGTVYGVLGVDILEDYLLRLLPYDELSEDHGSAYILGVRGAADPEASVRPQVVSGPVYLAASGFSTVYLEKESAGLYTLERGGGEEMYVCSAVLNLYNTNTPFADDQWVLLGAVPGRTLFALKHDTLLIMLALLASIVLTSLVTILITVRSVSQPIVKLAAEVRATDPAVPARLQKTDITELDALAGSIETLSDEVLRAGGKFTQILEMASVRMGGFEVDGRDGTLFLTDQFFDVFGRPELASTVRGPQSFERAMDALHVYVTEREKTDDEHTEYIFRMPEPDGVRWVRMRLLRSSSRWTGLAEDITSDRMSLERMEYERDHDVLTELYNRRAFKRMALALLARGPQAACVGALVMLDLDNLKYINDTYGHDMGDAYIRCMAASLPSPDGERCLVARMSGDEFFVLFHGYDTQEEVRGQIALLRQRMTRASLTLPDGVRQPVRASGGVAWYPADSDRFDELVRYADFAMYQVKNSGKGEFAEFDGEAYRRDTYLVQSRGVLHRLLEQRLVDYHFQPIVEVSTGRIFAYEALMRPRTPELSSPLAVLELARQEGKLRAVETLTWHTAMGAFAAHCRAGHVPEGCRVFINSLSNQAMLPEDTARFHREYRDYLSRVVLELTEVTRIDADLQAVKMQALMRSGGKLALDDYGSGYNGEAMLLAVQPDYVKIDVAIVRGVDQDDDKRQLVENLVSYAHVRGIALVGEGVETRAELEALAALGVDYVQGYFLARPALLPPPVTPEGAQCLRVLRGEMD